ncbi:unnamed protein product [Rangifer tarandus platyrhynchus]|uniref:Uncharacterized protein n=1 Tax=Rangifer tarandus platyrhynchus TaxID=3082113 RepID=A0AC59YQZ0_RANTA
MEERETEEVGGRSNWKNTATVSAASLPPCIGVTLHHSACRAKRNLKTQLKGTLNNISIRI